MYLNDKSLKILEYFFLLIKHKYSLFSLFELLDKLEEGQL